MAAIESEHETRLAAIESKLIHQREWNYPSRKKSKR
jgi:hypothetical protein